MKSWDERTTLNRMQTAKETRIQRARGQKRGKFISMNPSVSKGCSTWSTMNGALKMEQVGGRGVWVVRSVVEE